MKSDHTFSNPFSDSNANGMDSSKILEYWCDPFPLRQAQQVTESDIYRDITPMFFLGGRGTGKTMFLRYWSYEVQRERALSEIQSKSSNELVMMQYLREMGGIGLYLRIDGPALRSFEKKGVEQDQWDAIFAHFFELQICKRYVEMIIDLTDRDQISFERVATSFVPEMAKCLASPNSGIDSIRAILDRIECEIAVISEFRANIAFSDVRFSPSKAFGSQDLSFGVVRIIKRTLSEYFGDMNFVILIDEYENFNAQQQRMVNTLVKFAKPGITFRIGMRLEGFRSFETTSPKEFIKEGRDYRKIVFETHLTRNKMYSQFLIDVAKKRLESVTELKDKGYVDISKILGKKEDLEEEASELLRNKEDTTKHFRLLKLAQLDIPIENVKGIISNSDRPLLEMLNILWVLRGKSPDVTREAMCDYLNGKHSELAIKYKRDYVDKYKLSLMFLLASVYQKNKQYYSFNTFCFLSSGIVGNFIGLCRKSFEYACFYDPDMLWDQGVIPKELQNKAVHDVANTERQMIKRIQFHGDYIYHLAENLGNIFTKYHRDPFIRYPETNQFSIDKLSISNPIIRDALSAAEEWSIIQKKDMLQQTAPGMPKREIYTLNRILAPIFGITYRTRGGYSEMFDPADMDDLMMKDAAIPKMKLERRRTRNASGSDRNTNKTNTEERIFSTGEAKLQGRFDLGLD